MAEQQIPVLCDDCGGPVEPSTDFSLTCPYCGKEDTLPSDQLDRALELKRRVASAARAVDQLDRGQAALSHIFEDKWAFFRVQGAWLVVLVIVLVQVIPGTLKTVSSVPEAYRVGMIVQAALGPMFVAGIAMAFSLALLVGRISYRRRTRPLLLARPGREPGAPTRCRGCGGELPDQRGPLIRCEYCPTHNLVTPEIQRDREKLLKEEEQRYRDRAHQVVAQTAKKSIHMGRTLVVSIVLVYAMLIGMTYIASRLFPGG